MKTSSKTATLSADRTAISLLGISKQELRNLKETDHQTFVELRTFLLESQLEAKRIEGLTRLAIKRLNSI